MIAVDFVNKFSSKLQISSKYFKISTKSFHNFFADFSNIGVYKIPLKIVIEGKNECVINEFSIILIHSSFASSNIGTIKFFKISNVAYVNCCKYCINDDISLCAVSFLPHARIVKSLCITFNNLVTGLAVGIGIINSNLISSSFFFSASSSLSFSLSTSSFFFSVSSSFFLSLSSSTLSLSSCTSLSLSLSSSTLSLSSFSFSFFSFSAFSFSNFSFSSFSFCFFISSSFNFCLFLICSFII